MHQDMQPAWTAVAQLRCAHVTICTDMDQLRGSMDSFDTPNAVKQPFPAASVMA